MKKLLLMCCFLMGISAMSYAQGGGGGRRTPEDQAKQLQTQLKLTDDQTAKVLDVYKAQAVKRDSVMKAANGDRDAARQAFRPLQEATTAKLKTILTPAQATTLDSLNKARMARMQNGGGGGGGQN